MTRKDYILLAEALREARPPENTKEYNGWLRVHDSISNVLQKDNYNFNLDMFWLACNK